MSTLEKFGILVILILVVIIGVVAVWGVGGQEDNPFASGEETVAAAEDPAKAPAPGTDVKDWPPATSDPAATTPAPATGPVPAPALGTGPAPSPAPPAQAASSYTVQRGDTGASIAKKTLGDANRWKEIASVNGNQDARRLKIGQVLRIPGGGTSVASANGSSPVPTNSLAPAFPPNPADGATETAPAIKAPATAPAEPTLREVEVRNGDTLYGIALRELGNGDFHYKISQCNQGLDPRRLRPGMKIKVPAR